MDEFDDVLDSTIDDYLINLAHGIKEAQAQLNQLSVPGPAGQPSVQYHMPRIEFELKMTFAMTGQSGAQPGTSGGKPGRLLFRPSRPGAAPGPAGESYRGEATSTIRGSFVAVPIAGGRPPIVLSCGLQKKSKEEVQLLVLVEDALGAPRPDVEVEFNVDREHSQRLSKPVAPQLKLSAETDVLASVARTGPDGRAKGTLRIAATEPKGATIALTIDAAGSTETVLVTVE